jgi:integrase
MHADRGRRPDLPPQLRLLRAEDLVEESAGDGRLSPEMTLPAFYWSFFRPVELVDMRDSSENTLVLWDRSIGWWAEKMGEPPLAQIDERALASFQAAMRTATYARAKIGGKQYPVQPITAKRVVQQVQAVLRRATEKKLLDEEPRVKIRRVRTKQKPPFTPEQIPAVFEAAARQRRPENLPLPTPEFLKGLLAVALVTGVRKGTFFALEWPWFIHRPDGWWVDVPDHSVPKTDRGICVAIPEWLRIFLFRWPRVSGRVFENPWSLSHWDDCHVELQLAASIERPLSFQAWRRTLADQMIRCGAPSLQKAAAAALDHRDARTTEDFYASAANIFRRNFPPLFYVPPEDGQRRLFD